MPESKSDWARGDLVKTPMGLGRLVEYRPQNNGWLVLVRGYSYPGGFGTTELTKSFDLFDFLEEDTPELLEA